MSNRKLSWRNAPIFTKYGRSCVRASLALLTGLACALAFAQSRNRVMPWTHSAFAQEPTSSNTAARHAENAQLSHAGASYYQGNYSLEKLAQLAGAKNASSSYSATRDNELYDALHELMDSTQTFIPDYDGFAKGSVAYFWNFTDTSPDCNASADSHFLLFYSDVPYQYPNKPVDMNREHVWPKACASYYTNGGGADLHHIRPTDERINDAHSSCPFGNVQKLSKYTTDYGENGTPYYYSEKDGLFEPKDDVKGDIARILLYVYCRWEQPNLYSDLRKSELPALDADDEVNNGKRVIESLDTLLAWCAADPPDTWEMQRNDITQQIEGNRNVFIDYPEFAWQLFGKTIPANLVAPDHANYVAAASGNSVTREDQPISSETESVVSIAAAGGIGSALAIGFALFKTITNNRKQ